MLLTLFFFECLSVTQVASVISDLMSNIKEGVNIGIYIYIYNIG